MSTGLGFQPASVSVSASNSCGDNNVAWDFYVGTRSALIPHAEDGCRFKVAYPYLQVFTVQMIALQNERNDVDILRRRMDASALLIKALAEVRGLAGHDMDLTLTGKVALVTGSTAGIGLQPPSHLQ